MEENKKNHPQLKMLPTVLYCSFFDNPQTEVHKLFAREHPAGMKPLMICDEVRRFVHGDHQRTVPDQG